MSNFTFLHGITLLILLVTRMLHAVPLDNVTDAPPLQVEETTLSAAKIPAEVPNGNGVNESLSPAQQNELEADGSQQKPQTEGTRTSDNGNYDPSTAATSMLASFLTPEAIQQYVNQIGAAYPGYAAYPAPIGYAPAIPPSPQPPPPPGAAPIYPGPYVVQTGYEGYLVPATTTDLANNPQNNNNNGFLRPLTYLTNLFSAMMMSAFFRIVAAVFAGIGMIFFGGALSRLICSFTPLCAITSMAVEYLKSDNSNNAERVGRMIAEGMTPERVRRATEIVQTAIRKYQQLQKFVESEEKED